MLTPLLLIVLLKATAGQPDCQGSVGHYNYDLSPLANGQELMVTDTRGQAYYYKVCGVVDNQFCLTTSDSTPAVCQKDANAPPEYHDCGSQTTAQFGRLPGGDDFAGFTLGFEGGEAGRTTKIDYKWYQHLISVTPPSQRYVLLMDGNWRLPVVVVPHQLAMRAPARAALRLSRRTRH